MSWGLGGCLKTLSQILQCNYGVLTNFSVMSIMFSVTMSESKLQVAVQCPCACNMKTNT